MCRNTPPGGLVGAVSRSGLVVSPSGADRSARSRGVDPMSGSTSSDVAGGSSYPTDRRVVLHVSRVIPFGHIAVESMKSLGTCKRWDTRAHACFDWQGSWGCWMSAHSWLLRGPSEAILVEVVRHRRLKRHGRCRTPLGRYPPRSSEVQRSLAERTWMLGSCSASLGSSICIGSGAM